MEKNIYTKFSNDRSPQFDICTSITLDESGKRHVYKKSIGEDAVHHVEMLKENFQHLKTLFQGQGILVNRCIGSVEGEVELEFITGLSFEEELDEALSQNDGGVHFLELMEWYAGILRRTATQDFKVTEAFEEIFGKFEQLNANAGLKSMGISDIDLNFPNLVHTTEGYTILDYEWTFPFPIPVDYIIYRAIFFYAAGERGHCIEQLLKMEKLYHLLGVPEVLLDCFEQMERNFQMYIERGNVPLWSLYQKKGGATVGVTDFLSIAEAQHKNVTISIISEDGNVIRDCGAILLESGEYLIAIPCENSEQMHLRFHTGKCIYRIGGVFYLNSENAMVGIHYDASGRKVCGNYMFTADENIYMDILDIPKEITTVYVSYALNHMSMGFVMGLLVKETENEIELEHYKAEIEGYVKALEKEKKCGDIKKNDFRKRKK